MLQHRHWQDQPCRKPQADHLLLLQSKRSQGCTSCTGPLTMQESTLRDQFALGEKLATLFKHTPILHTIIDSASLTVIPNLNGVQQEV